MVDRDSETARSRRRTEPRRPGSVSDRKVAQNCRDRDTVNSLHFGQKKFIRGIFPRKKKVWKAFPMLYRVDMLCLCPGKLCLGSARCLGFSDQPASVRPGSGLPRLGRPLI